MRDWTESSARAYHLILLHYRPGLIAELQNHSKWIAGKAAQDYIALLLVIRDLGQACRLRWNAIMVTIIRDGEGNE